MFDLNAAFIFSFWNDIDFKGDTTMSNVHTGERTQYFGETAGTDQQSSLLSLGVHSSF